MSRVENYLGCHYIRNTYLVPGSGRTEVPSVSRASGRGMAASFMLDVIAGFMLLHPSCARRVPRKCTEISLTASNQYVGGSCYNLSRGIPQRYSGRPNFGQLSCFLAVRLHCCPPPQSWPQPRSLTPTVYARVGDLFRDRFGQRAGWAHSLLFAAELPAFKASICSLSLQPKWFSGHAKTHVVMVHAKIHLTSVCGSLTCGLLYGVGEENACSVRLVSSTQCTFLDWLQMSFLIGFACRRCFLRRCSSRWTNSVAKRGKRRRRRRQRKLEQRTRSRRKPHQRLKRVSEAQRFVRAGRVCN